MAIISKLKVWQAFKRRHPALPLRSREGYLFRLLNYRIIYMGKKDSVADVKRVARSLCGGCSGMIEGECKTADGRLLDTCWPHRLNMAQLVITELFGAPDA